MANISMTLGILLILLGLGAYFGTGRQSITALIPAFLGLLLAILGYLGQQTARLRMTMHIATGVAMVGFLGSVRGVPGMLSLISGEEVARPAAAVVQTVTALICLCFLVLAFKSFADARRNRQA